MKVEECNDFKSQFNQVLQLYQVLQWWLDLQHVPSPLKCIVKALDYENKYCRGLCGEGERYGRGFWGNHNLQFVSAG